jgi:hypothetical protein
MGSSNKSAQRAQQQADAAEKERRAAVERAQRAITAIYGSPQRETDIQDVENATRDYLQGDLNRQNATAARELRFALARSGQTMGSVDVDKNRTLAENFLRGAVEVQRRANAAGSALRQADQASKINLFSMAQQGLDATTAAQQAGEMMRANVATAKADALESGLGDVFSNLGDIYKKSRERAGAERAEKYQYNTFYTPNQWYGREFNFG